MTKYSSEFKVRFVSRYLEGGISYRNLCTEFGIPCTGIVKTWVSQAKMHGIESLKVKHTSVDYSQTFKIAVVEYVHTHQVSCAQTAAHFGISPSQVNSWNRIVRERGVTGLRAKHKGRPAMGKHKKTRPIKRLEPTQEEKYKQEILELKSKLHEAELDRDILKALATLMKNSPKRSPRK
ncbi:helix-turn-helix domain-containing protein [Loigolactobacillus bifermentans]|uniref:ISPsy8, transposase OrfA n=1 Tax=Loigolactobacillus bifermentans DSM 20003 TaxID=1423726 RepID=A0A0R1GWQ1_9LACO|nr:helix-turn-helix domain-containing protein [Loigolactobacillus bifermentans]KRK36467.1 ISPsy8, transposase OrfA [Loigolactobacillus bifermentans DSM 20003]